MLSDIEIARDAKLDNISEIAHKLGLTDADISKYGEVIAKVSGYQKYISNPIKQGKLILVTAMSPTKFGIGKTTVSIGLADALQKQGKSVCLALREPSLGPVFGIKGGAAGGGYAQVLPMEEINLNFTGDFDAITSATNLLSAMIDNHIFNGNELDIDENEILFHRCLDVNDRSLRSISYTIGGKDKHGEKQSIERKESFTITSASEIMAICCLSNTIDELKQKLGNIMVAKNKKGEPVFARDLHAEGSLAVLLRNVLSPNLVQTIEHTPALVHLGPFANIAHGCNSIIATKLALATADYTITEAGFGSDLGAEKFFDLKCRLGGLSPNAVVLVSTIRGLKFHGGSETEEGLNLSNITLIERGLENLYHHANVLTKTFGTSVVVTINRFLSDTDEEVDFVINKLSKKGILVVQNECFAKGGSGALALATAVTENLSNKPLKFAYNLNDSIEKKITDIVKNVYGGKGIILSDEAKSKIAFAEKYNFDKLPVIIAKTQFSLSDDQKKIGAPKNFEIFVKDIEIRAGAGFLVVIAGSIMLMPGLSKTPNAEKIDILPNGEIIGLS